MPRGIVLSLEIKGSAVAFGFLPGPISPRSFSFGEARGIARDWAQRSSPSKSWNRA